MMPLLSNYGFTPLVFRDRLLPLICAVIGVFVIFSMLNQNNPLPISAIFSRHEPTSDVFRHVSSFILSSI